MEAAKETKFGTKV